MPTSHFFEIKLEKRTAIIDRVIDYLLRVRYNDLVTNRLIAGIGLSKGSFYYYFKDIDDVYLYIFGLISEPIHERFREQSENNWISNMVKYPEDRKMEVFFDVKQPKKEVALFYFMIYEMDFSPNPMLHNTLMKFNRKLAKHMKVDYESAQKAGYIEGDVPFGVFFTTFLSFRRETYRLMKMYKDPNKISFKKINKEYMEMFSVIIDGLTVEV